MPSLTQYDLGKFGVNVDSSPIHKLDGELSRAQNAIRNPNVGAEGGITNRDGMSNLNGTATGGSVLGGVAVPLGNGPGSSTSAAPAEILLVASDDNGNAAVYYDRWSKSTDYGTTWTAPTYPLGLACDTTFDTIEILIPGRNTGVSSGLPVLRACVFNNRLYYASDNYTSGSESVPIRVFDGVSDYEFARIQPTTTKGIIAMVVSRGTIYVTTYDSGTTDADWVGRVFSLDPTTGHLTQIGPALTTGYLPTAVAMFNNDLFVAGSKQTKTAEAHIFKIRPGVEVAWTDDETLEADHYAVSHMYPWNGYLYIAPSSRVTVAGHIVRRNLAGTYANVKTFAVTGTNRNGLANFVEFKGALVNCVDNDSTDAGVWYSTDGTTWAKLTGADWGFLVASRHICYVFDQHATTGWYATSLTTFVATASVDPSDEADFHHTQLGAGILTPIETT